MSAADGVRVASLSTHLGPTKSSATNKRKRSDSNEPDDRPTRPTKRVSSFTPADDVLQVLREHDLTPSILDEPLVRADRVSSSRSPNAKRPRSPAPPSISIATKASQGVYESLDQLYGDVQMLCAGRRKAIEAAAGQSLPRADLPAEPTQTVDAPSELRRIEMFESHVVQTITKALLEARRRRTAGIQQHDIAIGTDPPAPLTHAKTVLSVFGNASVPRQLFSSFQHHPGGEDATRPDMPLEQLGLPNMMSASRILPCAADNATLPGASGLTIGDVFPPPASLPQLYPPKPFKQQHRRSTLTFSRSELIAVKQTRNTGYTGQSLKTGRWVGYGHRDGEPGRSNSKSKSRQGSTTKSPMGRDRAALDEEAMQEYSLLQAACSSFAPAFDDTNAVMGHRDLDTVWWKRYGARRYSDKFQFAVEADPGPQSERPRLDEQEADRFRDAMDSLDETMTDVVDEVLDPASSTEISTQSLLSEVTDLTETLAAHQHIRSMQVTAPSAKSLHTSEDPPHEETETYRRLQARLAELISRAPPYLLAKQDGERSGVLRTAQRLRIQAQQYSGVLEEDQITRAAKSAAAAAAAALSAKAQPSSTPYQRHPALAQSAIRAGRTAQIARAGSTSTQNTPIGSTGRAPSLSGAAAPVPVPVPATTPGTAPTNRMIPPQNAPVVNGQSTVPRPVGYDQTNGHVSPSVAGPIVGQATPRAPGYAKMGVATAPGYISSAPQRAPVTTSTTSTTSINGQSTPHAVVPGGGAPTGSDTSMKVEQRQQLTVDRAGAQIPPQAQTRISAQPTASVPQSVVPPSVNGAT